MQGYNKPLESYGQDPQRSVEVYWSEIIHYSGELEIPFDDLDSREAHEYIEKNLPFDIAKPVGSELEYNSVDAFEVE